MAHAGKNDGLSALHRVRRVHALGLGAQPLERALDTGEIARAVVD